MSLTLDEMYRYSQQIKLSSIGMEGQLKLKQAKVLCVGAGGLGSSLLFYLAASGIGTIGIADSDTIEPSNLHRQILYQTSDVDQKKAVIAKQRLMALNHHIDVYAYTEKINIKNITNLFNQYDIIADCSDNFATRYLINDTCFYLNKSYVFASISKFEGQCSLFLGNRNPCLRCLFPFESITSPILNCSEDGVLGVLPGMLGIIQAAEIIKWILKLEDTLAGYLLTVNILKNQFSKFKLTKNPECLLCVLKQTIEQLNPLKTCHTDQYAVSAHELQHKFKTGKEILLLDVRSIEEHEAFNLGGIWIPLSELASRLTELNPNKPLIIYCQSEKRSLQAINLLKKANFNHVWYLQGGINGWKESSIKSP